ncbi:uncharacterized protein JCM10292_001038, partial [Rhodotorula paludigena]|uniref:uncharacterized protein n=1 Tax=Rhodotorula paludigena TaxID=86838 RepID=UPI00316F96D4
MASFCADLPALPPTPAGTRSKRRLSSHAASPDPYDYDDGDDSVIDDDLAQPGKRSKRSRGANAATSGSPNRAAIGGAAAAQPQRALSDKEKEQ